MLYLLNKKHVDQIWQFLELLEKERAACVKLKEPVLRSFLENLHDSQIQQSRHKLKCLIEGNYEKAANDLLRYEANAHLMVYDILKWTRQNALFLRRQKGRSTGFKENSGTTSCPIIRSNYQTNSRIWKNRTYFSNETK
jgi:hypothetical protein